jgi:hypothetical protein
LASPVCVLAVSAISALLLRKPLWVVPCVRKGTKNGVGVGRGAPFASLQSPFLRCGTCPLASVIPEQHQCSDHSPPYAAPPMSESVA